MTKTDAAEPQGEAIFALWHELKKNTEMANQAALPDVEMILRMTSDILVQKYYAMGLPTRRDIHSLVWEDHEWPVPAATFLEMKSMLLAARETDLPDATDSTPFQHEDAKTALME